MKVSQFSVKKISLFEKLYRFISDFYHQILKLEDTLTKFIEKNNHIHESFTTFSEKSSFLKSYTDLCLTFIWSNRLIVIYQYEINWKKKKKKKNFLFMGVANLVMVFNNKKFRNFLGISKTR